MKKPNKQQLALERVKKSIAQIADLKNKRYNSPELHKWLRDTEIALSYTFGEKSRHVEDFKNVSYSPGAFTIGGGDHQFQKPYLRGLETAKSVLESIVDEIKEYWNDEEGSLASSSSIVGKQKQPFSNKIFIIHGHDDGAKETVARFVSKLGLEPIILHERPNEGRTIIEKFEENADVSYAIALLTPDDFGAAQINKEKLRARARQNVIFEFGYFVGKLGRRNACGVVKGDLEIPSDYSGVLYIPLDVEGAWRMKLVKELKAIGLDVDANLAL